MKKTCKTSRPRYREIEEMVRQLIQTENLPRHSLLPSENQLAHQFQVTPMTVRRAMDELVHDGVIYRKRGSGSFVAPRQQRSPVLIVPRLPGTSVLQHDGSGYSSFLLGALTAVQQNNLPHVPEIILQEDFLSNLNDLKLIYPRLAGMIFLRGFEVIESHWEAIRALDVPVLFFGPDIAWNPAYPMNCYFHDEHRLARMIAEYFASRGYRRIGNVITQKITQLRSSVFRKIAPEYGLTFLPEDEVILEEGSNFYSFKSVPPALPRILKECDVVIAASTCVAFALAQKMEREWGMRVGQDARLFGIDNKDATIPDGIHPSITSIEINEYDCGSDSFLRFSRYLESGETEHFTEYCKLILHQRESC